MSRKGNEDHMAFPDPSVTIATCEAKDCIECPVSESAQCHFRRVHLIYFLLISIPGLLVGGAGVLTSGISPLIIWSAIIVGFFGALKVSFCSRCMNFACPLNGVPDSGRALFFKCNPSVGDAWDRTRDS